MNPDQIVYSVKVGEKLYLIMRVKEKNCADKMKIAWMD